MLIYANVKMIPITDPLRWTNVWAHGEGRSVGAAGAGHGSWAASMASPSRRPEAAGVAYIYPAIVISIFVYKEITWSGSCRASRWNGACWSRRSR